MVYLLLGLLFLEILKKAENINKKKKIIKKKLWKWPVNWSFSELFYLFFSSPDPKSVKKFP